MTTPTMPDTGSLEAAELTAALRIVELCSQQPFKMDDILDKLSHAYEGVKAITRGDAVGGTVAAVRLPH